jgi:hypothetical protein
MGRKRIGLLRTKSLLEQLKRQIELESTTLKDMALQGHKRTVETNGDGSITLTNADAGKIIVLTRTSNSSIELPLVADAIGMEIDIITHTAQDHRVRETGNNDILSMVSVSAAGTERDDAFSIATLSAGAIGDRFHCYCNGTNWIISAFANAAVNAS